MTNYNELKTQYIFQDEGHLNKIHDAVTEEEKHYGMFIFDFGEVPPKTIACTLTLNYSSYSSTVPNESPMFDIIPGFFNNPENISECDFLDDISLDLCGWETFLIPNGSTGEEKELLYTVKSGDSEQNIIARFINTIETRYLGFLISPYVTSSEGDYHFEVTFNSDLSSVLQPVLLYQEAVTNIQSVDSVSGTDTTKYLSPKILIDKEKSIGKEHFSASSLLLEGDSGVLVDREKGIKIRGTDPFVNYSMLIQHIDVVEKGKIIEVYGFNGYTDRYYYPDSAFAFEKAILKKLNVVTWSGMLVEWPWASMLWYGEIIYFADQIEFNECCHTFFKEHGEDLCPVCGNSLGGHFKYSYIDITRIPHQIYFCSKDCMKGFNRQIMTYLKVLTKPNMSYLLGIKM